MRKHIITLLLLVGMADWCHAQKIPGEMKEILDNYFEDSTAEYGFLFAKKWLHLNDSIKINDLKLGKPIQEFAVKYSVLDTCSDTIPFYNIIEPTNYWLVPVMIGDKHIYELELSKSTGEWRFCRMSDLPPDNKWDQLQKNNSMSNGINPVIVIDGLSGYFYFRQIGPRKIYYIRSGREKDTLKTLFSGSIKELDDSKKLVKFWKKQGKGSNTTLDKAIHRLINEKKNGGDR